MLELIGLQEDLVERTCARVLENRENADLSATTVVFPSKRFGFFLRLELAARMQGHFFPPALFPIESFFESLFRLNFPGARILNELEAAQALHETAAAVFQGEMYGSRRIGDFVSFFPWARKILAALEEILTEGGRIEGIDFEKYEAFARLGDYHRSYKNFIKKLPELLAEFGRRLDDRRQTTKGMACRNVADLAEQNAIQVPVARHWIFSGFNAMNACEKKLFRFFDDRYGARLLLRTDSQALADPLSPFHLQDETIRSLGMSLPGEPVESDAWNDLAAKIAIHPCDGIESEMIHAFHLLDETRRGRNGEALRKIAVLLPSPPSLIPFIQGVVSRFDQDADELPFNITLGYPLERTPMMQLIDSLMTILENTDNGTIEAGDYLQLIRHPYVKISDNGGDPEPLKRGIHLLENLIDDENLINFSIEELETRFTAEIGRIAKELDPDLAAAIATSVRELHERFIPRKIASMPELLAFLRRVTESVGSERNRGAFLFLNEYAGAALEALAELEDFAAVHGATLAATDTSGMATMVRSHFRNRTINFEGSPVKGIQVMGPLEFRGLSFDEIIVLDALEGVLPGTAKYDPILPADIRAIFGIRDHGDWERIYALNFFAMVGSAKRVHILYPRRSEDGQERERSRFIERILYEMEKHKNPAPAAAAAPLPFAVTLRELKRVKKSEAVRRKLAALTLSPSSLGTYVQCPLRFYFREVLGLQEREEVVAETDGGLIGVIAHKALENFYQHHPAAGAMFEGGEAELDTALEHCLHEAFRRRHFDPEKGVERIRAWALFGQLRLFVHEDRRRIEKNGIRVETQEKKIGADFPIPGLDHPIRIEGRLDRLEREKSLLRVIDYKTGAPFAPRVRLDDSLDLKDLCRRGESSYFDALAAFRRKYPGRQLQIYLMIMAGERGVKWDVLDAAYVFLREQGGKMVQDVFATRGRDSRPFTADEKRAAMESFVDDLGEIIRDLHCRESFLPNPTDERYCSFCPFRLPCGNL